MVTRVTVANATTRSYDLDITIDDPIRKLENYKSGQEAQVNYLVGQRF